MKINAKKISIFFTFQLVTLMIGQNDLCRLTCKHNSSSFDKSLVDSETDTSATLLVFMSVCVNGCINVAGSKIYSLFSVVFAALMVRS